MASLGPFGTPLHTLFPNVCTHGKHESPIPDYNFPLDAFAADSGLLQPPKLSVTTFVVARLGPGTDGVSSVIVTVLLLNGIETTMFVGDVSSWPDTGSSSRVRFESGSRSQLWTLRHTWPRSS